MNTNSNPMDTNWQNTNNSASQNNHDYQTQNSSGFDKYGRPINPPPSKQENDMFSHLPADPSFNQGGNNQQ